MYTRIEENINSSYEIEIREELCEVIILESKKWKT